MRLLLLAIPLLLAAYAPHPATAAQPGTAEPVASETPGSGTPGSGDDKITFAQYRDWRLAFIDRRRSELAMQLSSADLPAKQKTRLEQTKAYYDWLAGLGDKERDQRFRERFDRIDANHDGVIDPAERTAWREHQSSFYHRASATQPKPPADAH